MTRLDCIYCSERQGVREKKTGKGEERARARGN